MYDLVIIGGSAAGTAAGVYAARRKLNFALISDDFGGEVATSGEIWNYPGFSETNGIELSDKFREHLTANNVEPELGVRVEQITKKGDVFEIKALKGGKEVVYQATAVIVAAGAHPRHLQIPGEEEYRGKGVTYCTTCDGPLYKGKKVVVVGGGNSGLESALMLGEIAQHVTLININDSFNGEQVLIDKVEAHDNIDVIYNAETSRIEGEMTVKNIIYNNTTTAEEHSVETDGVFVHIGVIPNSGMMPDGVELNKFKEVVVTQKCETSVPGLFAAGDVTSVPYKQIAIAVGQGVCAALSAIEYINRQE